MPRFVILRHETPPGCARPLHWDLMLEAAESLRTWALEREPAVGQWLAAESLADHRQAYLDYEGEISGGRGSVTRWDAGTFEWEKQSDCELIVRLAGQRLPGRATLRRSGPEDQRWRVRFWAE